MLTIAVLVRNEASRDLSRVLQTLRCVSDQVVVLDDRSTDETPQIAKDLGCIVEGRSILKNLAWGDEAPARAELWDLACQHAGDGWILFCDADQILVGDPRPFTLSWESNTVCLPLFDMWDSEDTFRADGYWTAYQVARPWMVRPKLVPDGWTPQWSRQGLHVGHLPSNWPFMNPIATDLIYFKHLAYLTPERRFAKYQQYMSKKDLLTPQEQAHAQSILD